MHLTYVSFESRTKENTISLDINRPDYLFRFVDSNRYYKYRLLKRDIATTRKHCQMELSQENGVSTTLYNTDLLSFL